VSNVVFVNWQIPEMIHTGLEVRKRDPIILKPEIFDLGNDDSI
jgi:hypothetical protein